MHTAAETSSFAAKLPDTVGTLLQHCVDILLRGYPPSGLRGILLQDCVDILLHHCVGTLLQV